MKLQWLAKALVAVISKLKAGDRVRVDFLVPDGVTQRLAAATIWPVR